MLPGTKGVRWCLRQTDSKTVKYCFPIFDRIGGQWQSLKGRAAAGPVAADQSYYVDK